MTIIVESGAVSSGCIVTDWDSMEVYGTAVQTTVSDDGEMIVFSGGVANNPTVNEGTIHISEGGVASDTIFNSGGLMTIFSGGAAYSTVLNNAYMHISSGGMADHTTVNTCGALSLWDGVANNTAVSGAYGRMYVSSGSVANRTTIYSGGSMFVWGGQRTIPPSTAVVICTSKVMVMFQLSN